MKINSILLNTRSEVDLLDDNPPPDAWLVLRQAFDSDQGTVYTPLGRIDLTHTDYGDARHFQLSLNGALVSEFLVCPTAGNTTAWNQFLAQFRARVAARLISRPGPERSVPASAPWVAVFFTDLTTLLPEETRIFLSCIFHAMVWWHVNPPEPRPPQAIFGSN